MSSLWAFVVVAAVVIATPGQDTALTIRNTLAGGRPGASQLRSGCRAVVRRGIDAVTGLVLVGLGVRLAGERR